jgi:hypothetical protein
MTVDPYPATGRERMTLGQRPRPAREPMAAARHRRAARSPSHDDVFAAVVDLSGRYHAPSTSLIASRLAPSGTVTGAFQSSVRDALEHLRAGGRLLCVVHRGTHRWTPALGRERPEA